MIDWWTHLAHTAEHAVDLVTGAIVGLAVQDADEGDTDDDGRNPHHRGGTGRRRSTPPGLSSMRSSSFKPKLSNSQRDDGRVCRDRGAELRLSEPDRVAEKSEKEF